MSSSPCGLTDMPDIVMKIILKQLDFRMIQLLRKVCQSLRNSIDNIKPDAKLTGIRISLKPQSAYIMFGELGGTGYWIEYRSHREGCQALTWKKGMAENEKLFPNSDFMNLFFGDLNLILMNQKSLFKDLSIFSVLTDEKKLSSSFEIFKNIFQSKKLKIQELKMHLNLFNQNHVMSILPFLDEDHLKSLELVKSNSVYSLKLLGTEQITKTEQWKNLKTVDLRGFRLAELLADDFATFEKVSVNVEEISVKELMKLKDIILLEPAFQEFKIYYNQPINETQLSDLLGLPYTLTTVLRSYIPPPVKKMWYYECPEEGFSLEMQIEKGNVVINGPDSVHFKRIKTEEIPKERDQAVGRNEF